MIKKKQHKCIILTLLLTFILVTFTPFQVRAADQVDSPNNAVFPSISELFNGQNKSKYLTTYRNNYYLDLKESGIFKAFDLNIFNTLANGIFGLQVLLTYAVITIVYYAFSLNIYDIFSPILDTVTKTLQSTMFNELSLVCISLLGLYYIIKMVRDQKTQVWVAIIETVAVMSLALWFFSSPTQALKGIDDFSRGMSTTVLSGTYSATNAGQTPDSATMAVCNNIWVMFVHKPWQVMEFGNTDLAAKNEDKILTLSPGDDDRQDIINDLAKDGQHFQSGWGIDRFAISLLYFIIFVIIAAVIIILAAIMLCYQVLSVIVAMLAPFVLLLALIPWFGMRILGSWTSKIVSYIGMRVVVSFLMAIVFSFMLATYDLSDQYSTFVIMLLQIIIIAAVFWKRQELIEMLFQLTTNARKTMENPSHVNKYIRKDMNVERAIRKKSPVKESYKEQPEQNGTTSGNMHSNESGDGSNEKFNYKEKTRDHRRNEGNYTDRNSNGSNSNEDYSKTKGTSNESDINGNIPRNNNASNNHDLNHYDLEYTPTGASNKNENADLKKLLKVAEEILEQRYELSKVQSEKKAERTNTKPEYSNFVQTAINREQMNLPKFEERQKLAVVEQIKTITASGGKIEELYVENNNAEKKVERPKQIIVNDDDKKQSGEIVIKHQGVEETVNRHELEVMKNKEAGENYTKEFNVEYDKKYDTKFMENLIKKYGRETVKETLNHMKKINRQEKIENPAGYLTQSLKNNAVNQENSIRNNNVVNQEDSIRKRVDK